LRPNVLIPVFHQLKLPGKEIGNAKLVIALAAMIALALGSTTFSAP
jgi:hypothetical protein